MTGHRIEIPFGKLSDKKYMEKIECKTSCTQEVETIFVTGAKGKNSKEILDLFVNSFSSHKVKADPDLEKIIENKNINNKNDIFQMPSIEIGSDFDDYFGIDDRRFSKDIEDKKKYAENIREKTEKERFKKADGKIGNFEQNAGDCWLLSRLAAKDDGRIKKEKDGSFVVTLNNPNKTEEIHKIKVTKEDFSAITNKDLSSGDPDAKIVEIATKKLFKLINKNKGSINIGTLNTAFALLSGKTPEFLGSLPQRLLMAHPEEKQIKLNEAIKMLDKIGNTKKAATAGTAFINNKDYMSFTGKPLLNTAKFIDEHGYTIVKTDPIHKTVTLKNPYDTSKNLIITYKEFLNNFESIALEK